MSSLSINHVCLAGHLTRDPVLRKTNSGVPVADLGLAINDDYTAKDGKVVEQTCFTDCVVWGKSAEATTSYLKKGDPALVLLLGCPQKSAQGMALALMVPMAALGVYQYARAPGVVLQGVPIALLVAGAALGVLAGTRLLARVPDFWLQRAFAIFLVIVAVRMFWSSTPKTVNSDAAVPCTDLRTGK